LRIERAVRAAVELERRPRWRVAAGAVEDAERPRVDADAELAPLDGGKVEAIDELERCGVRGNRRCLASMVARGTVEPK
jgi:hypothetical protein